MADKIKCPKCGAENYPTDPVCMSCGASLKEPPAPVAPAKPTPVGPPTATTRPGPGGPAKKTPEPAAPASALGPWLMVLGLSLAATAMEMVILNAVSHGVNPKALWGLDYNGTAAARIVVWTLIFGVLRTLLIGGLMYLTPWGPTVGLIIGLALGFTGLGTPIGGPVIGFVIGVILEHHKFVPPPR